MSESARNRLIEIIVKAIIDSGPLGDHPPNIADALLASEEWLAREALIRAAKREHEGCDGVGIDLEEEASAPCALCHYLARLAAVRGTT